MSVYHCPHDVCLIMYRNGCVVDMDGRDGGIIAGCVCEYVTGRDWFPLRCNEYVWLVPGTLDPGYECLNGETT